MVIKYIYSKAYLLKNKLSLNNFLFNKIMDLLSIRIVCKKRYNFTNDIDG